MPVDSTETVMQGHVHLAIPTDRYRLMTSDTRHGSLTDDDCRLADLADLVNQKTDLADYPYASTVEQNVPVYDGVRLRAELSRPAGRAAGEAELAGGPLDGPGTRGPGGAVDGPWV